ncbi:unnamed protein product [Ceutorhynchus assimilis]|uniref:Uncharacterized protein n=1 Tax=Ceutorhynchus assimilis TaxID=467358 RepID=A0A9N9MXK7_9CUCU|nr:unnamed protein product [Ceutorhynchus assimilis]
MPKAKPSVMEVIKNYKELTYESVRLFCRACVKMTSLHQQCLKNFTNKPKQTTIAESLGSTSGQSDQRNFNLDLCRAMVQSNIPLNKLRNDGLKSFLETYSHGLNRVAETIRQQFPLVNELIKNGKKVFVKAHLRVQLFKERLPNIPLPPEPVLTRWGTWLDAALYYADHYENFKNVIFELPETASKAIKDCQTVLNQNELINNLSYMKANFSFVSTTIKSLEKQGMTLDSSIKMIDDFEKAIDNVPGATGQIRNFDNNISSNSQTSYGNNQLYHTNNTNSRNYASNSNQNPYSQQRSDNFNNFNDNNYNNNANSCNPNFNYAKNSRKRSSNNHQNFYNQNNYGQQNDSCNLSRNQNLSSHRNHNFNQYRFNQKNPKRQKLANAQLHNIETENNLLTIKLQALKEEKQTLLKNYEIERKLFDKIQEEHNKLKVKEIRIEELEEMNKLLKKIIVDLENFLTDKEATIVKVNKLKLALEKDLSKTQETLKFLEEKLEAQETKKPEFNCIQIKVRQLESEKENLNKSLNLEWETFDKSFHTEHEEYESYRENINIKNVGLAKENLANK